MTIECAILLLVLLLFIAVLWVGFDVVCIKRVLRDSLTTPPKNSVNNTTKQGNQKDNKE